MTSPPREKTLPCVVCGKPQAPLFRPFCSKRCADLDLGRWLNGNYIIPDRDADAEERPSLPGHDENTPGADD